MTTKISVGDKYAWKGGIATVQNAIDNMVLFSTGANKTGYTSQSKFLRIGKKIEPKIIPKKTLKTSSAGEHQDILQIPKDGSTKLYTIIAGVALIIIFFGTKVFKKLIK